VKLIPLILLVTLAGCSDVFRAFETQQSFNRHGVEHYTDADVYPAPGVICWSKGVSRGAPQWLEEARSRWGENVIVFSCHGFRGFNNEWLLWPDQGPAIPVRDVAWTLHKLWPSKTIVLITCNPGHADLGVPQVFYAKTIVASDPRYWKDDWAHSIAEFSN
jgi:hypothetical protein